MLGLFYDVVPLRVLYEYVNSVILVLRRLEIRLSVHGVNKRKAFSVGVAAAFSYFLSVKLGDKPDIIHKPVYVSEKL